MRSCLAVLFTRLKRSCFECASCVQVGCRSCLQSPRLWAFTALRICSSMCAASEYVFDSIVYCDGSLTVMASRCAPCRRVLPTRCQRFVTCGTTRNRGGWAACAGVALRHAVGALSQASCAAVSSVAAVCRGHVLYSPGYNELQRPRDVSWIPPLLFVGCPSHLTSTAMRLSAPTRALTPRWSDQVAAMQTATTGAAHLTHTFCSVG